MRQDQRKYPRTPIKLIVQLRFSELPEIEVETWDISDGGIGIHFPREHDIHWYIGMHTYARVLGLPIEGPEIPMKVVRITEDRIGLQMRS